MSYDIGDINNFTDNLNFSFKTFLLELEDTTVITANFALALMFHIIMLIKFYHFP